MIAENVRMIQALKVINGKAVEMACQLLMLIPFTSKG